MGWGTDFKADIYLNRMQFSSVCEVEDKIKELQDDNDLWEKRILMFCSANPKDIVPDEWKDDAIMFIHNQVSELILMIKENSVTISNLILYKDYLSQNNEEVHSVS